MRRLARCPYCYARNDCHDRRHPLDRPRHGDASICWYCRCIAVFENVPGGGVVLRRPTAQELEEMATDPRLESALVAIAETRDAHEAVTLWRGASS